MNGRFPLARHGHEKARYLAGFFLALVAFGFGAGRVPWGCGGVFSMTRSTSSGSIVSRGGSTGCDGALGFVVMCLALDSGGSVGCAGGFRGAGMVWL